MELVRKRWEGLMAHLPWKLITTSNFYRLIFLPWLAVRHLDAPIGPRKGFGCMVSQKMLTGERNG